MSTKLVRPRGLPRSALCQPTQEAPEKTAPAQAPDGVLLQPSEVAKRLGVSEHVLERWRGTGEGPKFIRFSSKTLRYRATDLDAFVEARVVSSTAAR